MKQGRKRPGFDKTYHNTFYRDTSSRAKDTKAFATLVTHITAYLDYLDVPVQQVLNVGCGLVFHKLRRGPVPAEPFIGCAVRA